jgi:7,8-dihydropterin-6-yl-methyl-4-(beta-D-ribofuranosyl)aminobenzene 5'-phosphate synthase
MAVEQFGAVDKVNLTILVDNRADLIVKSDERVKYFTDKALLAEHGFSVLVHFWEADSGREVKILWDAGDTQVTLMENLRRMEIDPKTVDKIALSHGHHDHYAALTDFLKAMELEVESREWPEPVISAKVDEWLASRRVPLIAHPAAFRERWWTKKDGTRVGPISPPPWLLWEALGAAIQRSESPYPLGSGCWTSGYIPRRSFEQTGRPSDLFYRQGDRFIPDDLEEDQAIVLHVKGKGLVILSGCAHAGILNTIEQAREISGIERVHAIIGGFHLARSESAEIDQTIAFIQALKPTILVPCHCTGFQAMCAFARQMPEVFIPGVVGATYLF